MTSTGFELPGSLVSDKDGSHAYHDKELHEEARIGSGGSDAGSVKASHDSTHRQLRPRHIQLIGIGGTALYVQIGRGLINGGPASLFMAFTIWYVNS
jgi:amino acid transporter